jgi:2-oxoglutarate ferredoxin oxidoreductase subunit delta
MSGGKELIINTEWCKGCGICSGFCPKKVLKVENGKIVKVDPDACIYCGQCELRCPDNAIFITGGKK